MYKVLVADDEPVALKHICSIIDKKCEEFEVCATAENGQEALDKIRLMSPDLVISDIKMPLINGIKLAEINHQGKSQVYFIIVSGYQSFEYAQRAIRTDVVDYILKPIVPSVLQKSLEKFTDMIRKDNYYTRNKIIRKICRGEKVSKEVLERCFPDGKLYAAVLRENGLPRRFSIENGVEIYSGIEERFTVFGRDEMESLYLIPQEILGEETFFEYMMKIMKRQKKSDEYLTLVYCSGSFRLNELPEKVWNLYRLLDRTVTVGYTQVIKLSSAAIKLEKETDIIEPSFEKILQEIEGLMRLKKYEQLKKKLTLLYTGWEKEKKPQYWVEYCSRQIYYTIQRYYDKKCRQSLIENEYMIDDAFYNATTMAILEENMLDIFFQKADEQVVPKVDSPEFFSEIIDYMESHIRDDISLQIVCRQFGVSQTYISKLFRKYTDHSFNQKLTEIRMEKAKALICKNNELYFKDIASMVGYQDQFYFSRVFRSYTGRSPSEYADEIEKGTK